MEQHIKGDNNIQAGGDVNLVQHPVVTGTYTVACPNCSNPVSRSTESCPLCGHPVSRHLENERLARLSSIWKRRLIILAAVLLLITWISSIVSHPLLDWIKILGFGLLVFGTLGLGAIKEKIK